MSDMINVDFLMQSDGKTYHEKIDRKITIDRMIANFLEKLKLIHDLNKYSFMVGGTPLEKDKFLKKQVKHVNVIKPNCKIKVKYIGKVKGAVKS